MKTKIIAANWKMYKTPHEARAYFEEWALLWKKFNISPSAEIVFFPSALCAESVDRSLVSARHELGHRFFWGLQNSYVKAQGAFTGENSALVSRYMGAEYLLVGHSERRQLFKEQGNFLYEKVKYGLENELQVVFCIGESLEEREGGETLSVLKKQIEEVLTPLGANQELFKIAQKALTIAYEPVWAIGTGKVATVAQVRETHQWVLDILSVLHFSGCRILYGGSVKSDNARELISIPNVDGFLVGGASLVPESFLQICEAVGYE